MGRTCGDFHTHPLSVRSGPGHSQRTLQRRLRAPGLALFCQLAIVQLPVGGHVVLWRGVLQKPLGRLAVLLSARDRA